MKLDFEINTSDALEISDSELSDLLTQVYVNDGFTTAKDANVIFQPSAVRNRGLLIIARTSNHEPINHLAGMIILVHPESNAIRLAKHNEAEIQLLGVRQEYRRHGLGQKLVEKAISLARIRGYKRLILWTQTGMQSAQRLYESKGFIYVKNITRSDKTFRVYELPL